MIIKLENSMASYRKYQELLSVQEERPYWHLLKQRFDLEEKIKIQREDDRDTQFQTKYLIFPMIL
jgi:hypothetical protein